jgi:uncharacterized damage-inducible protein DinB
VAPSALSLLGLVRHMAEVERVWFRDVLTGEESLRTWNPGSNGRAEFDVDDADPAEAFRVWNAECARSRAAVEAATSLDVLGRYRGDTFSLRYIVTHMIEEYARHNGHADLLRERMDGVTGE